MARKYKKCYIIALVIIFTFGTLTMAKQYEGPVPEKFNQSPQLEQLVDEGKLPPVEERIPDKEDLYVIEPNDSIGKYGGTFKAATIQPEGYGDDNFISIFTNPLKSNIDGSEIVPHIAKKVESSDDKTSWTMYLRKGMKWSDGEPFTADDILFWYEDVLLNEELTPVVGTAWKSDGEVVEINKMDEYTVEFNFKSPKPYFKNRLCFSGAWDLFMPKHYLKQFHPDYTSEEELNEIIEEEGYDEWYELFQNKNSTIYGQSITVDRPSLAPFVLVKKTSSIRVYERNPYYWKVDTEGNQLPYIDRIEGEIVSDREIIQGKVMSGDIDFVGINADIRNYPMYKKYEEEGGYKTYLWESAYGSEGVYTLNLTHEEPDMRKIFQNVGFRRALSLAIDREEINNAIYYGNASPRQFTVIESSEFFEPEFAKAYTEYDPERAKKLLDEIELKDINGNGWRQLPDGEEFTFTIEIFDIATPRMANAEIVVSHWQDIGINVNVKQISGELQGQRAPANMMDATMWNDGSATDINFPTDPRHVVPTHPRWEEATFTEWSRWFETDGEKGMEPPEEMKEIRSWWENMLSEPEHEKRIELGKKILEKQADQIWGIGTIGNAPCPFTMNENIKNVPENGIWGWATLWLLSQDPEQLYFDE